MVTGQRGFGGPEIMVRHAAYIAPEIEK